MNTKYLRSTILVVILLLITGIGLLFFGCTKPPVADISSDKDVIIAGNSIRFIDNSTGKIKSWLWDFGDGETISDQNPSHTFQTKGDYTVSLTITNKAGSNSANIPIRVLDAPAANIFVENASVAIGKPALWQ